MELHKFNNELFKTIKDVGYQSCCLRTFDDDVLVTYNTPKTTIAKKLEEIKNRFQVLPPGVYRLQCMARHGAKQKADIFYIQHGEVDANKFINERPPPTPALKEQPHVLSYEEALKRIEEMAIIKSDNLRLVAENELLKQQNLELANELEELEAETETLEEAKPGFNLADFAASVMPVLDRYFDTKERELNIKEKMVRPIQQPRVIRQRQEQPANRLPDINNPAEMEQFITALDNLNDADLNNALNEIANLDANLYAYCVAELYQEEEEEQATE